MLNKEQLQDVENFVSRFTRDELLWLSGYLAAKASGTGASESATTNAEPAIKKITVAYGTETGNSKKVATAVAAAAKKLKINAKITNVEKFSLADLEKEEHVFIVMSTHGDGTPPISAEKFHTEVVTANAANLKNLKYGILSLGDSAYPLFCKAGADLDTALEKLGAQRVVLRKDCDVDYADDSAAWIQEISTFLAGASTKATPQTQNNGTAQKKQGRQTYTGVVTVNQNLNDVGSKKQTHHIEILSDTEVDYLPGDSLGLTPPNLDEEVNKALTLLNANGSETVEYKGEKTTLYEVLKTKLNIRLLPSRILDKYAVLEDTGLTIKGNYDLIGLLTAFPPYVTKNDPQKLVDILEGIAPRLYSISSSPEAHGKEIHLTVARQNFVSQGELKYGLCSDFLSCFSENGKVDFYIQKNNVFRLPDDEKDIIMVGPGTGIAPFRSFVAERDARSASGKNWLFFGEQHQQTDFLYQTEWQEYLETGSLTKLDLAFSRDNSEKEYVQHKMKKQATELYEWLQNGAYLYICGAKEPMAVDVENTLADIITEAGNTTREKALEYIEKLKEEDRYLKDVY